jgi:small subunit ribosomal protein S7
MPRKKTASLVRVIAPDRKYNSEQVQRLINRVMLDGKKTVAERIVYTAMDTATLKLKEKDALNVLEKALNNVKPSVETRSRRVGGANFQVPFEVKGQRQSHLTLMWFVGAARSRKGIPMEQRLAAEIMDAFNGQGSAVKKKEDTHRMAEANRAFAHFARF